MKKTVERPVFLKRFGQHVLHDHNYLRKIVELAQVNKEDVCLEIGAGTGNLTRFLVERAGRVVAVEIDKKLIEPLRRDIPGAEIVGGDFLKIDIDRLVGECGISPKWKVVSNLPYNITSPVLFRLLEKKRYFSAIFLLIQLEVAERVVSPPGTKKYGILSVFCRLEAECGIILRAPRTVFFPKPRVDSALLKLVPLREPRFQTGNPECFRSIVRSMFEHRRKTCYNSLRFGFKEGRCRGLLREGVKVDDFVREALKMAGIEEKERPESVPVEKFARLSEWISSESGGRKD